MKTSLLKQHPYLHYQLLWLPYLAWFFAINGRIPARVLVHSPLDDYIPFNEWFIFPYGSWFFLLGGVTLLLWWNDTQSYRRLVAMMFSGMFFCLAVYMILPTGLALRPETVERRNIAMTLMRLIWRVDAPACVCPSIHCQSSGAMALAFAKSRLAAGRRWALPLAVGWAGLICLSTLFTKQHSVWDVALGLALVVPWYFILYKKPRRGRNEESV